MTLCKKKSDCQKVSCSKCQPPDELQTSAPIETGDKRKSKRPKIEPKATVSSMAALNDIVTAYKALKVEWNKKPQKLDKCGEILEKLKVKI